ncbi:MAG: hypothetical protein NVS3B10_06690 [Polyangiales bacterium]
MARAMKTLDLGCGPDKLPGAIGMDVNPASAADVIHDLDVRPWPFEAGTFDHVRAENVLEHVVDFIGAMEEIHRVCRDGATVQIRMPFMSSVNFATDPTHRRAGTARTFAYFDPTTVLGRYAYSKVRFDLAEFKYLRGYVGDVGSVMKVLDKVMIPLLEKHANTYEHYFAYLYPMHDIEYLLRVRKAG